MAISHFTPSTFHEQRTGWMGAIEHRDEAKLRAEALKASTRASEEQLKDPKQADNPAKNKPVEE